MIPRDVQEELRRARKVMENWPGYDRIAMVYEIRRLVDILEDVWENRDER